MLTNTRAFVLPLLLSGLASGCYAEAGASMSTTPAYVQPAPPPPAQPVVVVAPPPAPPPPPPEVVPAPPGPEYGWAPGYHRWNGRAYEWQRGHYERRPHSNAIYVAGHWEKRERGHVWVEGHWQ